MSDTQRNDNLSKLLDDPQAPMKEPKSISASEIASKAAEEQVDEFGGLVRELQSRLLPVLKDYDMVKATGNSDIVLPDLGASSAMQRSFWMLASGVAANNNILREIINDLDI